MALWGNKDSKTASGTVTIASNGAVTGSSTAFTTQARVGDYMRVAGEDYLITAIASDTAATVRAGVPGATLSVISSGLGYTLSEKPKFVTAAESSGSDAGVHGDPTKVYGVDATEESQAAAKAQGVAHAGWVRRTVGTGNRSGRVFTEVLVAGGSITGDQLDDTQFPDRTITITSQPQDAEAPTGESATFEVTATVSPTTTLTYLWQVSTNGGEDWSSASGTNDGTTYTVADNTGLDGNLYRVRIAATGATTVFSNAAAIVELV